MLLGEVASKATVSYEQVIRETVKAVGYDNEDKGLDWRTMSVTCLRLGKKSGEKWWSDFWKTTLFVCSREGVCNHFMLGLHDNFSY